MSIMVKRCGQILVKLIKNKSGRVLKKLVNAVGLKLLVSHNIIKPPMDSGSVKSQLDSEVHLSFFDFIFNVWANFQQIQCFTTPKAKMGIICRNIFSIS